MNYDVTWDDLGRLKRRRMSVGLVVSGCVILASMVVVASVKYFNLNHKVESTSLVVTAVKKSMKPRRHHSESLCVVLNRVTQISSVAQSARLAKACHMALP